MSLDEHFDAVILLSETAWSDDANERASRLSRHFARQLPVFFVQRTPMEQDTIETTASAVAGVEVVNISRVARRELACDFKRFLSVRGIVAPLLWIEDPAEYVALIDAIPLGFRVVWASDSLAHVLRDPEGRGRAPYLPVQHALRGTDLLLGCDQDTVDSCAALGNPVGQRAVVTTSEDRGKELNDTSEAVRQLESSRVQPVSDWTETGRAIEVSVLAARRQAMQRTQSFRVALLYDSEGSMHVGTIKEHIEAFRKYSAHSVLLLPATSGYWRHFGDAQRFDLSFVDAIIVHYSVRLSVPDHLDPCLAQAIASFPGLKMLFLQDEYENTETARAWMDRLAFDVVYTCVPEESLATVYPAFRFPATRFIQTLTGYVPEDPEIDRYGLPLAERKLLIGYRGRRLPAKYGQLGREKEQIGVEMRRVAEDRSFAVDIEVDDSKRIYGADWYRFLGSVRATLGTESGANLFDWVGELDARTKQQAAAHAAGKSDTGAPPMLEAEEGEIRMNQISPKVFEAIRLRTALVLFEGSYSGVVKPGVHYLPLKKDFSNVDEVLARLQDDAFLLAMTDRAYDDIIASGAYSYQRFVAGVDGEIRRRLVRVNPCAPILGPLMFRDATGVLKQGLPHYFLNINDMRRGLGEAAATMGREEWSMAGHLAGSDASENTSGRTPESTLTERAKAVGARIGRRLWPSVVAIGRKSWLSRWLPVDVKTRIFNWYRRFLDS